MKIINKSSIKQRRQEKFERRFSPTGQYTIFKAKKTRDGSVKQVAEIGIYDQYPFAEHISKITVSKDTPLSLLNEWNEEWAIDAQVIMKKPSLRTPISKRPPKREPKHNAYNRKKTQKETRELYEEARLRYTTRKEDICFDD